MIIIYISGKRVAIIKMKMKLNNFLVGELLTINIVTLLVEFPLQNYVTCFDRVLTCFVTCFIGIRVNFLIML